MRTCLNAEPRSGENRSALRALRNEGRLPCVVYGRKVDGMRIHISVKDMKKQMQTGKTELIDLQVEGQRYPVLLKEVQRDPISGELLHADFHQITMDQPVRMKVSVELVGTAPGVKAGGLLQVQAAQVEVEGLPERIPPAIETDIGKLEIGNKLTAGDLSLPDGITLISSPDELLASVIIPRAMKESEEPTATAEKEAGEEEEQGTD